MASEHQMPASKQQPASSKVSARPLRSGAEAASASPSTQITPWLCPLGPLCCCSHPGACLEGIGSQPSLGADTTRLPPSAPLSCEIRAELAALGS